MKILALFLILSLNFALLLLGNSDALAATAIKLSNITYRDCPIEMSKGNVGSGSSIEANCFLVNGKAQNLSGKTVYDADVFGRILDANNEPAMQNRNLSLIHI